MSIVGSYPATYATIDNGDKGDKMKRLFATTQDRLLTIATLISLLMLIFPPVGAFHEEGYTFFGYEFVFDLYKNRSVDVGRLLLQLLGLGFVSTLLYRMLNTSDRGVTSA